MIRRMGAVRSGLAMSLLALLLGVGLATASVLYAVTPGPRFFGYAQAGDQVGATIDGASCGDAVTAADDGLWILDLNSDAACRPSVGDEVSFTLNGAPTNETETYAAGGSSADAINGTTLTLAPIPAPAPAVPRVPGLASFRLNDAGDAAAIGWTRPDTSTFFQFCSSPPSLSPWSALESCERVSDAAVDVDWDTVVVEGDDLDHLEMGNGVILVPDSWLYTSMRACNAAGCSRDSQGPQAGGLRWTEFEIDYAYMAVAFDFTQTQFTIVIVVNVDGPPREFTITSCTESVYCSPFYAEVLGEHQEKLTRCRVVRAGSRCIAYVEKGEQLAMVNIISRGKGTPTTQHLITVR